MKRRGLLAHAGPARLQSRQGGRQSFVAGEPGFRKALRYSETHRNFRHPGEEDMRRSRCWPAQLKKHGWQLERQPRFVRWPGPAKSVLFRAARLTVRLADALEVRDRHRRAGELRGDLQRAAKRLDIAPKVAHIHVRALFELGDGGLIDLEDSGELFLRKLPRLAQLGKRHFGLKLGHARRHPRLARGREFSGQLAEWAMAAHGIEPSFLNSS